MFIFCIVHLLLCHRLVSAPCSFIALFICYNFIGLNKRHVHSLHCSFIALFICCILSGLDQRGVHLLRCGVFARSLVVHLLHCSFIALFICYIIIGMDQRGVHLLRCGVFACLPLPFGQFPARRRKEKKLFSFFASRHFEKSQRCQSDALCSIDHLEWDRTRIHIGRLYKGEMLIRY